ncbi:alpha/beta hydrolase fold domain-containing protein [Nonomuraea sp. NPDC059023]|uniref:alpha/beta hydrolase fold domain-containing protein n=1 Tax=unclassified Nonomuraea TaxID=2593643 RepID=UPI0036C61BD1
MSDAMSAQVLPLPSAPDSIELRHLRAFTVVAEELNFSRAADRLYLSQPALSRQIRFLERVVNCDLLRRTTRRVELTLAGEALLDHAHRILAGLDKAVSDTRAASGEPAAHLASHWGAFGDKPMEGDVEKVRAACEDLLAQFPVEPKITVRPVNAGGVASLVAAPRPQAPITMLHLHGGGYIAGSAFGYRSLATALASVAERAVIVPDYRLAPEHPFPAALDDAQYTYEWLLDHGRAPSELTVVGDSSGGGLALSLLIRLKQQGLPLPARAVLLCPWVNLAVKYDRAVQGSVVSMAALRRMAGLYLAESLVDDPAIDPLIDPLNADLSGLPPLLIQAGSGEPILEDAQRLADHATAHGVDAQLEIYPVDTHNFPLFWSFLPEAVDALHRIGAYVGGTGSLEARPAT